jgi:hypothetical protein
MIIYYLAYKKIETDKFQFVLFPVKLNYTVFSADNYIFKTECSANILYYSLVMVRVGVSIKILLEYNGSLKKIFFSKPLNDLIIISNHFKIIINKIIPYFLTF